MAELHADWSIVLTHHEDSGEVREQLTLKGNDVGELIGEALHSAIRWEGDNGNGPLEKLNDILFMLTANYATFQRAELGVLQQVLLKHQLGNYAGDGADNLREIMRTMTD